MPARWTFPITASRSASALVSTLILTGWDDPRRVRPLWPGSDARGPPLRARGRALRPQRDGSEMWTRSVQHNGRIEVPAGYGQDRLCQYQQKGFCIAGYRGNGETHCRTGNVMPDGVEDGRPDCAGEPPFCRSRAPCDAESMRLGRGMCREEYPKFGRQATTLNARDGRTRSYPTLSFQRR